MHTTTGRKNDEPDTEIEWDEIGPLAWDVLRLLRRSTRRIERRLDRVLAVQGLTLTHLELLHETEHRNVTPGVLGRTLGMTRQAAAQIVTKLSDDGLLELFVAASGRTCARLTPYGRERLYEGVRWLDDELAAVERVPTKHRRTLVESLERLDVAVTGPRPSPWRYDGTRLTPR